MLDYLIVGSGLAGISFAEVALKNNKSITKNINYSLVYDSLNSYYHCSEICKDC